MLRHFSYVSIIKFCIIKLPVFFLPTQIPSMFNDSSDLQPIGWTRYRVNGE